MATQPTNPAATRVPHVLQNRKRNLEAGPNLKIAAIAWLVAAIYYFFQYVLRSAPSVMMPQLSTAFGMNMVGVASLIGLFYYGYSPFSLIAGAGMDRVGPRKIVPIAAAAAGLGALLFATGNPTAGSVGRLLQGAGGVFAPVGAIYIASKYFRPSQAATLIGATQMFGMAGGAAGQFIVGPLIARGVAWDTFWIGLGITVLLISALLLALLPKDETPKNPSSQQTYWSRLLSRLQEPPVHSMRIDCWPPVHPYYHLRHGLGSPLPSGRTRLRLRFCRFSYRYGPVGMDHRLSAAGFHFRSARTSKTGDYRSCGLLLVCLAWILFGPTQVLPPYLLGFVAGIASGSAMLPYTVIKEANPPQFGGIATGVVNFLNFTFSALLGPIFGWLLQYLSGASGTMRLHHFQIAFAPLLLGVAIAIVLAFFLKETGSKSRDPVFHVKQEIYP